MNLLFILLIYLILINIFAVCITIYDKSRAIHHKWRVKESTLLLVSAFGGSVGMYFTMLLIHHKTKHLKFMVGIPAILIFELLAVFFVWRITSVEVHFVVIPSTPR